MAEKKTTKPSKASVARAHAQAIKDHGTNHVGGFVTFVREQGVVGLAVGLAVGTAAGSAVKSIVDGLINPIVGFIIGGVDLSKLKWVVVAPNAQGVGGLVFAWGAILSAIITLLATALVIYQLIHLAKLDRIDKKKE
jgi:large conductance mechanosensitive channel